MCFKSWVICFFVYFLHLLSVFSPSHVKQQGTPQRHIYASGDKQATYSVLSFGSTIAELRNFCADLKDRDFLQGIICRFTHRTQNLIF